MELPDVKPGVSQIRQLAAQNPTAPHLTSEGLQQLADGNGSRTVKTEDSRGQSHSPQQQEQNLNVDNSDDNSSASSESTQPRSFNGRPLRWAAEQARANWKNAQKQAQDIGILLADDQRQWLALQDEQSPITEQDHDGVDSPTPESLSLSSEDSTFRASPEAESNNDASEQGEDDDFSDNSSSNTRSDVTMSDDESDQDYLDINGIYHYRSKTGVKRRLDIYKRKSHAAKEKQLRESESDDGSADGSIIASSSKTRKRPRRPDGRCRDSFKSRSKRSTSGSALETNIDATDARGDGHSKPDSHETSESGLESSNSSDEDSEDSSTATLCTGIHSYRSTEGLKRRREERKRKSLSTNAKRLRVRSESSSDDLSERSNSALTLKRSKRDDRRRSSSNSPEFKHEASSMTEQLATCCTTTAGVALRHRQSETPNSQAAGASADISDEQATTATTSVLKSEPAKPKFEPEEHDTSNELAVDYLRTVNAGTSSSGLSQNQAAFLPSQASASTVKPWLNCSIQ